MTAAKALKEPAVVYGRALPRIAPPRPLQADTAGLVAEAASLGLALVPWQEVAGRYLTATRPDGSALFREVCIVMARQNGKTTLMHPFITRALRAGKRVMHIAQTRELPRRMFDVIGSALSNEPELFPKRRGKTIWPRYGAGQEEIRLANGGSYRIAASRTDAARGWTNDLVIIDELLTMESWDIIAAAEPTLMTTGGQMVYLSNAGNDRSVVLNAARERAGTDPSLAYLEWSASPERERDDVEGWREANPLMGHAPFVLPTLEKVYRSTVLAGVPAKFETEHLCRWVASEAVPLVDAGAWNAAYTEALGIARGGFMGIAMAPEGTKASAAMAWRRKDGTIALTMLENGTGSPVDADLFGARLREHAGARRVMAAGFDPGTDAASARFLHKARAISGREFANATQAFVQLVEGGQLRWQGAEAVTADLTYTTRKEHDESGTFMAVRANEDVPITAVLAAVRAVWLATLSPTGGVRVY